MNTTMVSGVSLEQSLLRLWGILYGIPLLIIAAFSLSFNLLDKKSSYRIDKISFYNWLVYCFWMAIAGTLVGFTNHNSYTYMSGDIFKAMVFPLSLYITTKYFKKYNQYKLFLFITICSLIDLIPEVIDVLIQAISSDGYRRQGTRNELLYSFFLVSFLAANKSSSRKTFFCFISILLFFLTIISGSRSAIFLLLVNTFIIVYFTGARKLTSTLKPLSISLLLISLVLLGIPQARDKAASFAQLAYGRVSSTYDPKSQTVDISTLGRLLEVKYAFAEFMRKSDNPVSFISNALVGMGGGAEYKIPPDTIHPRLKNYLEAAGGKSHQIHIGFFSIFFRYGLIGFVLFNFAYIYTLYKIFKLSNYFVKIKDYCGIVICVSIFTFFISKFINMISIYSIVGNLTMGVLLGIIINYSNNFSILLYARNTTEN